VKIINFNKNKIKELDAILNKKIQEAKLYSKNMIDLSQNLEKKEGNIKKKDALLRASQEEVNKLMYIVLSINIK
jgi:hypothetical protein